MADTELDLVEQIHAELPPDALLASPRRQDVMMLLFNELYTMTMPLLLPSHRWMIHIMSHQLSHTDVNWWPSLRAGCRTPHCNVIVASMPLPWGGMCWSGYLRGGGGTSPDLGALGGGTPRPNLSSERDGWEAGNTVDATMLRAGVETGVSFVEVLFV